MELGLGVEVLFRARGVAVFVGIPLRPNLGSVFLPWDTALDEGLAFFFTWTEAGVFLGRLVRRVPLTAGRLALVLRVIVIAQSIRTLRLSYPRILWSTPGA